MSFSGLTPEALVQRSDSKNPATTCQGLTTTGKRCRRSLGGTPNSSPGASPTQNKDMAGVVAILNEENAAAFFCWQHQTQAQNLVARIQEHRRRTTIVPLQKRSSIDTLAEKVGILNLDDEVVDTAASPASQLEDPQQRMRRQNRAGGSGTVSGMVSERKRVKKRDTLPQEWQHVQGPLMSVPEEVLNEALPEQAKLPSRPRPSQRPQPDKYRRSNVKASWACCIRADDDYNDDGPPARRREKIDRIEHSRPKPRLHRDQPSSHGPSANMAAMESTSNKPKVARLPQMQQQASPDQPINVQTPTRPLAQPITSTTNSPPHTQTQSLLSIIPANLDPSTTSLILSELSKPMPADDEPGYIYIFWLTPATDPAKPDDDIASTLLDDDTLSYQRESSLYPDLSISAFRRPSHDVSPRRRKNELTQQALARFASIRRGNHKDPDRILLKIGRAQNVHRRMTQWTKQCNQNITLIRYYPMPASAAADPNSPGGIKVPHVVRVERLIHLELRGMGMGKKNIEKCIECGREHREWFEVPATRDGLRIVDGVVRRWVRWGESAG